MSSELLLSTSCRQPDPWDYDTSSQWIECRKKVIKIQAVIVAVIVVLLVIVFMFLVRKPLVVLAVLGIGGLLLGSILIFGKRREEQRYANMTRDFITHLRPVNDFPYQDFMSQEVDLIDIVKYAENMKATSQTEEDKAKYASMDAAIDAAYAEFIKQKQEDKRQARMAQAYASRSYHGPTIRL